MELNGDILISAPREQVWQGLINPETLKHCIPGCESMEATSPTERTAHVAVKIGPVRARFVGHVKMEDIVDNQSCLLRFEGSGGAAGMAKGHSNVVLTDEGDGTRLRYTVNASIGGKLGQVGGRMIDAAAKQMADQFFTAFNQQMLSPGKNNPTASTALVMATPPSTAGLPPLNNAAPATNSPASASESLRVLWFAMGALSTGFGVWIASLFLN
jgi:carbon monoxide dehydrogenase subunit G